MTKVELELTEETLRRARQSAEADHATLEHWLAEAIERTTASVAAPDSLLGLFSDAPELMGAVTENTMTAREQHPLFSSAVASLDIACQSGYIGQTQGRNVL